MATLLLDAMTNAAPWTALAADGVTPSTQIAVVVDGSRPRPNWNFPSGRITGTANSLNHLLRRTLPATDLSTFDDLRLWMYVDQPANNTSGRPLFLELKFASVAVPFADPGNTWQRYLPFSQARNWEPVTLSLSDMPAAVRSAVTGIQFRSALSGQSFSCLINDIITVSEHMIGDVDAALLALLNNGVSINGNAVPAVPHPAGGKIAQARPYFEITQYDVVFSRERTDSARPRGDYSDKGYVLRGPSVAYDLYYQITAVADDRATQAEMLEFALQTLPARGELLVNGLGLPIESVAVYAFDQLGGSRTDAIPLFYRVFTRREPVSVTTITPVQTINFESDLQGLGGGKGGVQ